MQGYAEAYSKPFQTFKTELFLKIVNGFHSLKVHESVIHCRKCYQVQPSWSLTYVH